MPKFLACRSVDCQQSSCSISYDTAADRWLISSISMPSDQSPAFHFVSQLLDQIIVGLQVAAVDLRSVMAQFPLHGLSLLYNKQVDFIGAVNRDYSFENLHYL